MGNTRSQISSLQRNSFARSSLVGPQLPPSMRQHEPIKSVALDHLNDQVMAADSPEPLPPGVDSLPPPPLPPLTPNVNEIGKVASSIAQQHQRNVVDGQNGNVSGSGNQAERSPETRNEQPQQKDVNEKKDVIDDRESPSSIYHEQSTERYRPSALLSNILKSSTVQQQDEHQSSPSNSHIGYRGNDSPNRRKQYFDNDGYQYDRSRSPRHHGLVSYYDHDSLTPSQQDSRDSSPHRQHSLGHRDYIDPPLLQDQQYANDAFEFENNRGTEDSFHQEHYSRYDDANVSYNNNRGSQLREYEKQKDSASAYVKLSESLKLLQQPTSQQYSQQHQQQHQQPVVVEPRPDLKPVIDRLAEYVAKNGNEFEDGIKEKKDPRFDFLNNWNVYHGYYLQKKNKAVQVLEKEKLEGLYNRLMLFC